ncbi:MAG: Fumarate reductase subunit [Chloroflexi bacterium]|jgi:fumarate reductase subunit C|nr:Fumarate reductase subunit [Chloroflexota bacterium]
MSQIQANSAWVRNIAVSPNRYHRADEPGLVPTWWRANRRFALYMLRELASVFLAVWSLRLLRQLNLLRQGEEAYDTFVAKQRRLPWLLFHISAFSFALLHSVTFLIAAGKGPTLHFMGRKVSERTITAGAFAGWAIASLAVLLALLFGGRGEDT